jgi:hypothetical protein
VSVSPFGRGNSCSAWQASDAVLHALSGELSRSGIRGREPLLPPGQLAWQCAAVQAAFVSLQAYFFALRSGKGDCIDFAALDGAMQALDPGFGMGGSATLGRPAHLLSRERPAKGFQYPILPCADGHVRLCLLAARQWQGMFRWMGQPAAFADPSFNKTAARYKSPDLLPALAAFFADKTRAELEAGAIANGVPLSGLTTLAEAPMQPHFADRAAFRSEAVGANSYPVPNGCIVIDGERMTPDPALVDEGLVAGSDDVRAPFQGRDGCWPIRAPMWSRWRAARFRMAIANPICPMASRRASRQAIATSAGWDWTCVRRRDGRFSSGSLSRQTSCCRISSLVRWTRWNWAPMSLPRSTRA